MSDEDVHRRGGGVQLPPYAINVFVPLVDFTRDVGPTEFTLGSHMWGSTWADDEEAEAPLVDHAFLVPKACATVSYPTPHIPASLHP